MSTAAKITTTMIFFMMFFRKARKRHVRPKDLLSTKNDEVRSIIFGAVFATSTSVW